MLRAAKAFFDFCLDRILSPDKQVRLGMHLVNRVRGDGDYDPRTNGEYWALSEIKRQYRGKDVVIFDVGANVGDWTREAAAGLSSGSVLYGIEPTGASFARYKEAASAMLTAASIRPVQAAFSDRDGTGTVYVDGDLHATNSMHEHRLPEAAGAAVRRAQKVETVPLMRGDTFCRNQGIERVHFLKIDAEGHDVPVLRGFEGMLAAKKIDYVQFEYCHVWIDAGHFLHEAVELLRGKGYILGKLWRNRLLFPGAYDKNWDKFEYANFLAIRSPELAENWPSRRKPVR